MLFKQATLDGIAAGKVRLAFRRWTRPTVRAGGTLTTAIGVLAIEAVDAIEFADLTDEQAVLAGFASIEALRRDLRQEGQLYRIVFHRMGDDPRIALRDAAALDEADVGMLRVALARLDRSHRAGPWTTVVLGLIAGQDGITAAEIAARLGCEKLALKADIRKLKALGLTESLQVGYRLSPRGRALLDWPEAVEKIVGER
ncbi:hypothetical protein [Labrys sp. (in: a-proteobacteria)]|uniref:hypothetical protein n=1 Tax=Labrys sp. (in: a-proteobacteria) TaxID=1917972 RepID=UPI0039E31478